MYIFGRFKGTLPPRPSFLWIALTNWRLRTGRTLSITFLLRTAYTSEKPSCTHGRVFLATGVALNTAIALFETAEKGAGFFLGLEPKGRHCVSMLLVEKQLTEWLTSGSGELQTHPSLSSIVTPAAETRKGGRPIPII